MAHWLFKSEPQVFSIDDLKAKRRAAWDGVRNYTARNFLRDRVAVGDTVFFYHSSCPEPGIAGLATVTKAGFPDPSAFERAHSYYDPKSDPAAPRWFAVEVAFKAKAAALIPLAWLRADPVASGMELFRLNRLSITPVDAAQARHLLSLPAWKAGGTPVKG
jgi:predicted RNA-binding protein with PUA-like domain